MRKQHNGATGQGTEGAYDREGTERSTSMVTTETLKLVRAFAQAWTSRSRLQTQIPSGSNRGRSPLTYRGLGSPVDLMDLWICKAPSFRTTWRPGQAMGTGNGIPRMEGSALAPGHGNSAVVGPRGVEPRTNGLCLPLQLSLPVSGLWSGLSLVITTYPYSLYTFQMQAFGLARDYHALPQRLPRI